MKIGSTRLLVPAIATGLVLLSVPRVAHALGPVSVEVAARGGVASSPTKDQPNPLGWGIGGRAGVSIFSFYGGLSLMYYFGGKASQPSVDTSNHTLMYGIEGGVNIGVPFVTIRPQVGIGDFSVSASCSSDSGPTCTGGSNLYIEPGVVALVSLGQLLVGADADLLFVPNLDSAKVAVAGNLQVGAKF
jgi:hypothetical protein